MTDLISKLPFPALVAVFFLAQLLNVIFSAGRTILLVKGTKWQGVIANTIHYTVNAATVSIISKVSVFWVVVLVTMVSNFIGAIIAYEATKKMRKNRLWRVSLYVEENEIEMIKHELNSIDLLYITMGERDDRMRVIDVFTHNKKESVLLQQIIKARELPYVVTESHKAVAAR